MKEEALIIADDLDAMKLFGASGMIRRLVEELDKQTYKADLLENRLRVITGKEASAKIKGILKFDDGTVYTEEPAYIAPQTKPLSDEEIMQIADSFEEIVPLDRKSTRLNSSHIPLSRMPSSA